MEPIGKKSLEQLESGYIWAPYVPMQNMVIMPGRRIRALHDLWGFPLSKNAAPPVGVSSRYSINKVNSNFYGTIEINKNAD